MPIYEYECLSCDKIVEVMQGISEEPLSVCPSCSGKMRKLVSRSAFHLKGGGWYADGYSNGGPGCAAGSSDSGSGDSAKPGASGCPGSCAKAAGGCPASS